MFRYLCVYLLLCLGVATVNSSTENQPPSEAEEKVLENVLDAVGLDDQAQPTTVSAADDKFVATKLSPQALEQYREKGLYKGWRLFFENHVDTNNKESTRAIANTYIATLIQNLSGVKEPEDIDTPLQNLATYLNLLFVELDLGEAPEITEYQRDILFNLVFDIQAKRADSTDEVASFDDLSVALTQIKEDIAKFYKKHDACKVLVQVNRSTAEDNIVALSISVDETEENLKCSNRPEQFDFNNETLWVNQIDMQGDVEIHHMGVYLNDIHDMLEIERREKTGYMINGIEGFSQADLINLADHISHIYYASAGGQIANEALSALPTHVMKLREGRGITFENLEAIGDAVTGYYRSKGLILATVYIPTQDFQYANGNIKLALLKGILGGVEVRGVNELHYNKETIIQAFKPHIGKQVTDAVSDGYFLVNSLPGLSVESGLFEAGENPGETKLVLDVKEKNLVFSASVDNYGTELTGKNRFMITGGWLNPTGVGDVVSMGYLRTGNPSNANLGFINYKLPVIDARTSMALAFDTNIYEASKRFGESSTAVATGSTSGLDSLTKGQTYAFMAGLNRKLKASKDFNVDSGLHLSYKRSTTALIIFSGENKAETGGNSEDVIGTVLTGHVDFLNPVLRSVFSLDSSLSSGIVQPSNKTKKDYGFGKIYFSMKSNTLIPLTKHIRSKFGTTLKMAYSGSRLPDAEQFPLSGPYAVKAFPSSAFIADSGMFFSVEWDVDVLDVLPWESITRNNSLDVGFFYEESYGTLYALEHDADKDSWANLAGYGLIARYEWQRSFIIDSSFSKPAKANNGGPIELIGERDDNQFLMSFKYIFN